MSESQCVPGTDDLEIIEALRGAGLPSDQLEALREPSGRVDFLRENGSAHWAADFVLSRLTDPNSFLGRRLLQGLCPATAGRLEIDDVSWIASRDLPAICLNGIEDETVQRLQAQLRDSDSSKDAAHLPNDRARVRDPRAALPNVRVRPTRRRRQPSVSASHAGRVPHSLGTPRVLGGRHLPHGHRPTRHPRPAAGTVGGSGRGATTRGVGRFLGEAERPADNPDLAARSHA